MALFDKVLVANRGEIAVRVIRTLKALGIHSVAVYSAADSKARHVAEADSARYLGPAPATESYLDIGKVVAAAVESGAQAVHPGYGFLSENPAFARALAEAGITLIGPNLGALEAMADKIRAKKLVAARNVPLASGFSAAGLSDEQIAEQASRVGFPLLIKPSAGGGGKGMVQVYEPGQLPAGLATARRIAAASFGDDTLLLERLVSRPRHIEVQVLADTHGNVVHLGERECSLQRRHQKVIEEAPSALLPSLENGSQVRERLGAAAVEAARAVDYVGAGTVEFLVSAEAPEEFFFMEMNTRLQVEHPVTEQVVRVAGQPLDLVAWQVRVAAGQRLDFAQEQVEMVGHAIEARLYAEVPEHDFVPATGVVEHYAEPVLPGLRMDSMLAPGVEVSAHYDPMLAKLIATGPDREAAVRRLRQGLESLSVFGVRTNAGFLAALLDAPQVRAGELDTELIARFLDGWQPSAPGFRNLAQAAAIWLARRPAGSGPWACDGFSNTGRRTRTVVFEHDGQHQTIKALPTAEGWQLSLDGERATLAREGDLLLLDGQPLPHAHQEGDTLWVEHGAETFALRVVGREEQLASQLAAIERTASPLDDQLTSPMPGAVCVINVQDGQQVEAGQVLLAVEAMKMEHEITAPAAGRVKLLVRLGEQLSARQPVAAMHYASAGNDTEES